MVNFIPTARDGRTPMRHCISIALGGTLTALTAARRALAVVLLCFSVISVQAITAERAEALSSQSRSCVAVARTAGIALLVAILVTTVGAENADGSVIPVLGAVWTLVFLALILTNAGQELVDRQRGSHSCHSRTMPPPPPIGSLIAQIALIQLVQEHFTAGLIVRMVLVTVLSGLIMYALGLLAAKAWLFRRKS